MPVRPRAKLADGLCESISYREIAFMSQTSDQLPTPYPWDVHTEGQGSFHKCRDPNRDPNILQPLLWNTHKKVSLCRSLRCWTHEHEITLNPNDTRRSVRGYSWSKQYPSARSKMRDSSNQINTYSQTRASNHRFTRSNVDAPRILILQRKNPTPNFKF